MSSARALLRAKRQEARVTHPLASYTSAGQLRCLACGTIVKQSFSWEGHVGSKAHRMAAARLREEEHRREAEERAKREAIARQQTYQRASAQEKERCRKRDQTLRISVFWNLSRSLERFRLVSTEFDEIKFCATQPLTFHSVPWPVMHSPHTLDAEHIVWEAVEEFFEDLEDRLSADEYRNLVEKTHRRFHPDRWRSRGLLNTVLDEKLREQWEEISGLFAYGECRADASFPVPLRYNSPAFTTSN